MIPLGIASGVLGTIQTIGGMRGLNRMGDRPEFSIGEDVNTTIDMLKDKSRMGLTPTQKASMWNDVTRGEAAGFANARNLGGNNVAAAAVAGATGANLRARMNIGVQDVMAQERALQRMLPWIQYKQRLLDNITGDRMRVWDRKAMEYGRAVQSGLNNVANMFNLNQMVKAGQAGAGAAGAVPGAMDRGVGGIEKAASITPAMMASRFEVPTTPGEALPSMDMPLGPVRTDWTPAADQQLIESPGFNPNQRALDYLQSILNPNR